MHEVTPYTATSVRRYEKEVVKKLSVEAQDALIIGKDSEEAVPINQYAGLSGLGSGGAQVAWKMGATTDDKSCQTHNSLLPSVPVLGFYTSSRRLSSLPPSINSQEMESFYKR